MSTILSCQKSYSVITTFAFHPYALLSTIQLERYLMLKANPHLESDFPVFFKVRFYSIFICKYNFSFNG